MTTKSAEKRPLLSKMKRRLLSAAIIVFVPPIVFCAVALYETSPYTSVTFLILSQLDS